jgi:hypothetical protein
MNRTRNGRTILLKAGAILALLGAGGAGCRSEATPASEPAALAPPSSATPGTPGGSTRVTVMTPAQAAAYRTGLAPMFSPPPGLAAVRADEAGPINVAIARVNPDGTITRSCVDTVDSAMDFLQAAPQARPAVE